MLSGLARGPYLVNRIFAELFPDVGAFHMVSAPPSPARCGGRRGGRQLTFFRNSDFAVLVFDASTPWPPV